MIKARAKNFILLGLSDVNMERLKKGQPIKFKLQEMGNDMPPVDVVIYNGRTEESMQAEFQDFITSMTNYTNTKKDLQ